MKSNNKKLIIAAMLVALGVVCSPLSIPVGASKCFPVQHLINVLGAVILGPWLTIAMAFCTSLIRFLLGTGTILAFPGSMIGACLASLFYYFGKKKIFAVVGEVIGTGIFGSLSAFLIMRFFMSNEVAVFAYTIPFALSSVVGAIIGWFILILFEKSGVLKTFINK